MKKVLVVDDSKAVQRLVSKCIESIGSEVVGYADDGEDGFEKFKSLHPDLVLLDITMPNKDGRECLKDILAHNADARVVMLSALNSQEVIQDCLQMGAVAFLNKPSLSERSELENELRRILDSSKKVG